MGQKYLLSSSSLRKLFTFVVCTEQIYRQHHFSFIRWQIETDAGVAELGGTLGIVWPYTATTATCNKLAQKII